MLIMIACALFLCCSRRLSLFRSRKWLKWSPHEPIYTAPLPVVAPILPYVTRQVLFLQVVNLQMLSTARRAVARSDKPAVTRLERGFALFLWFLCHNTGFVSDVFHFFLCSAVVWKILHLVHVFVFRSNSTAITSEAQQRFIGEWVPWKKNTIHFALLKISYQKGGQAAWHSEMRSPRIFIAIHTCVML